MTTVTAGSARLNPWRVVYRAAALLPLWLFLVLFLTGRFNAFFGRPPDVLGLPLGVVSLGLAFGWMLIGAALVWNARSAALAFFAILLFAFPATFGLIFYPAIILILQNFG